MYSTITSSSLSMANNVSPQVPTQPREFWMLGQAPARGQSTLVDPTLIDIPISFFTVLTLLKADEHPDAEVCQYLKLWYSPWQNH
jgi:hypothetical protein